MPAPRVAVPSVSRLEPDSRLQFLPGIGPARARLFERLELTTIEQLARHYPRLWLDARRFVPIAKLEPGAMLTVRGTIRHAVALRTRGGRSDFTATVADGSGTLGCYFFGQPFLARTLRPGLDVVVSGELDGAEGRMLNPSFEVVESDVEELLHVGRLVPVHALTRGLSARMIRRAVRAALDVVKPRLADPLPAEVAAAAGYGPLAEALEHIHFPPDEAARDRARARLAFEELFVLQTVLALRRRARTESGRGLAHLGTGRLAAAAREALPFTLTTDQEHALADIERELAAPQPMQRLLLGDVGSGKTVVAALAALRVIEGGHAVAFLAPTEILARQHGDTLTRVCAPAGVDVAVLTGATPAAARRALQQRLDQREPLLVVGTHALLVDTLRLPGLGLAIMDEQHRFGVRQRAGLAAKSVMPDVLVLTATPIPRTLQLTFFGDLDVSRLHGRPAGRGRLVTRVAGEEKFPQVVEFLARELAAGRQAYVVVPRVEDSGEARAVAAEADRLAQHPQLRRFRIGMLHGRLAREKQREVMRLFVAGELEVLVATTVIEVGVDVPNATLMVVENAERFGLTQLHQLRGRVGRGPHRSVCVLIPGPAAGTLARRRLDVLAATDDGFEIAEKDLELRGPGDAWGTRQSGLPNLRLADPARDRGLLEQALEAARALVDADRHLLAPAHAALRRTIEAGYREAIDLAGGA